ncbi:MAG: 50S ribosomal protein L23 [bacterium]|nr:50S ribosomal protein L23 [bacterium]
MMKEIETIIIRPIITEKCTDLREKQNIYSFEVLKNVTKHEIMHAIEKMYGVTVERVNLVNTKGKVKTKRFIEGKRPDIKKAYVKIKKGDKIQIFEGV